MTYDNFKGAIDELAAKAAGSRWDGAVPLTQARDAVDGLVVRDWYRHEAGKRHAAVAILGEVIERLTDAEIANVILSLAGDHAEAGHLLARALRDHVAREVQDGAQAVADMMEVDAIHNRGHRRIEMC